MTSGTSTGEVALYGHWTCPFVHRVAWALAERGIQHDDVDVPPSAVRPKDFVLPPEFVDHSPRLEIPMVRVGDAYRADSIPVLEWLEIAVPDAPPLLPRDDAGAAHVRDRMRWIDVEVFRPMIGVYYGVDPVRIAEASSALAVALDDMSRWLDDEPWLAGPAPTLADAVFVPVLVRADALAQLGFGHDLPEPVLDYGARLRAGRGWPAVAWTQEQTDELVGRFRARRRKVLARTETPAP
jgi:glutathione S-transferase